FVGRISIPSATSVQVVGAALAYRGKHLVRALNDMKTIHRNLRLRQRLMDSLTALCRHIDRNILNVSLPCFGALSHPHGDSFAAASVNDIKDPAAVQIRKDDRPRLQPDSFSRSSQHVADPTEAVLIDPQPAHQTLVHI